ncbi:MAG: pantoate--beta-alanine ligase [Oligoflexales bacterium]|nr:pantoate--beta-alanine ligase [Oligoflexales bacterium]
MSKVIQNLPEWQALRSSPFFEKKSVGFVPTMGALHEGHLSLLRRSIEENELTVLSVFVNPTQFNNPEDLLHYPRTLSRDCAMAKDLGVDFVLCPEFSDIYPDSYRYKIEENQLSQHLCGAHRPGHFSGVLTVVMKLFHLVKPTRAYFGEKDYQQYLLIKGMAEAFFMDVSIIPCAILRADDGLALSSRNERLTPEERLKAPQLAKILKEGKDLVEIQAQLEEAGFKVDYVHEQEGRRFVAAYLGSVRLIDNQMFHRDH